MQGLKGREFAFLVSIASVALALGLQMLLSGLIGSVVPFILFFGAVILSAWLGGLGPGLLATALSGLAAGWVFVPATTGAGASVPDVVRLAIFLTEGACISLLCEAGQRTERKLIESEGRFRRVVEANIVGIVFWTAEGQISEANDAFLQMVRYSREDLQTGKVQWLKMTPPQYDALDQRALAQLAQTGVCEPFEKEYLRQDGSRVPVLIYAATLEGASDRGVAVIIDQTERQRAEQAQQRLAALVENSSDFISLADLDGQVLFINEAGRRLVGLPADRGVETLHLVDFGPFEDRERFEGLLLELLKTGRWEGELRYRDFESGAPIAVSCNAFVICERDTQVPLALATVTRDIRDRKRYEAEREELLSNERSARAAAEQANRLKDEFLATLSHELRSPLNAMLGWAQILRTRDLDSAMQKQALAVIERNARAQNQLIEDLLDVSRIVTGRLRLDVGPVELLTVIEGALDTVRPAAEAKGIRLSAVLDPKAGPVAGDSDRLSQVVWNLLSNAVKFTPNGGRVQIALLRANSHSEIVVSDNGMGIAPEVLSRVFERFSQADSTSTRAYGGLGLGLAIVRQLIELHGGTVTAESPGPGKGATFTVRLPLQVLSQEPLEVRQPPAIEVAPVAYPKLDGVRVLVVDDEPDVRDLLSAVLTECGALITAAASVREALVLLDAFRPDVIISDIGMPGEDGYAFIRQVRVLEASRGGTTPAAALTAYARPEDRTRALLAGFQLHLAKPVAPAELVAVVATLSGRRPG